MIMRLSYAVLLATAFTASCLLAHPQLGSSELEHEDDDNFEPEPVSAEDAYKLLYGTERRAYDPQNDDTRTFGVIVDCGSSGTRAHLYEWDAKLSYPQLLHHIEPMRDSDKQPLSKKFSPSLSKYADESTEELEKYIQKVLTYIETHIQRKHHPFTGVYILATAGMRLLDDDTQKRMMADIAAYIKRNYNFAKVKTSVISGAHEGMYQWISVNAKAKRFLSHDTDGRTKTNAVIEMGGASIQVTYQLRPGVSEIMSSFLEGAEEREVYRAQIVEPQISRKNDSEHSYILHSTTFLGFGSNSAREAYLDLLLYNHFRGNSFTRFIKKTQKFIKTYLDLNEKDAKNKDKEMEDILVEDPCSPQGYTSEPLKKPERLLKSKGQILGFLLEEDEPYFSYQVKGTGNYGKCKKLVEKMLELSKSERLNCKPKGEEACTMTLLGQHFVPFESVDFLGIGDIFYTTNLMLRAAGTYNHQTIVTRTKNICNSSYGKLARQYSYLQSNPSLKSRIFEECFKAVWVDTFLVKGLNMPVNLNTLKTVDRINGDALEWTLGAVLDKSLAIEEAAEDNAQQIYGLENKDIHVLRGPAVKPTVEGSTDDEEKYELDLGLDEKILVS